MHGKRINLISHHTIAELIKFRNTLTKANEILHVSLIILMQNENISSFNASNRLKVNPEAARRWLIRYNEYGLDGLLDKRKNNKRGDTFKTEAFLKSLEKIVNVDCIYGGVWNGKKLQRWVYENYARKFVISTIYKWLYEMGFSWKSPRPKHVKGNKLEQEKFKKNNLPI